MSVWIGKTLGKIQIEKLLGRGGMAEVYLGMHTTLSRPVAVKILHGYLDEQDDLSERFTREARVAAGLRHPNIVQVYDFDVFDGRPYIVMEYINGPSLHSYLHSLHERDALMPLGMIRRLVPMIASALDYAHSQGLIHRDIKPGNILLQSRTEKIVLGEPLPQDVEPLLADFGLVRVLDAAKQTSSGVITGTPAYMSPEQARGLVTNYSTDVYSFGVLLYELLSGTLPFEGYSAFSVIQKVIHEPPAPIPDLAPELQQVLDRALQKEPDRRYQSAGELSNAFLTALGVSTEANTIPPLHLPELQQEKETPILETPIVVKPSQRKQWLFPILGVLAVGLVALGVFFFGSFRTRGAILPAATHPSSVGVLRFQNIVASLDGVTVKVTGMSSPAQGSHYEVWLTQGENRRSLGILELDAQGAGTLSFADDQSRNLLGRYDSMEVTLEPSPDPSPNSSGQVAFSSRIPTNALVHVRHVLVSIHDTPHQIGLMDGLLTDSTLVDNEANAMLAAFDANDKVAAMRHAEAILNLIVGSQSPDYGDLDGDGKVTDPGDGYGLLLNGESPGYTGGVESHTMYAMQSGDASEAIITHGMHVITSVTNVEDWLVQLRDLCKAILRDSSDLEMRSTMVQAVALADQIVKGVDLDGNERIDAIPGEGGVLTAYQHSYYMADMVILFGANQVMPPGPTPDVTPESY
jgi:serine/threonine protein kinase